MDVSAFFGVKILLCLIGVSAVLAFGIAFYLQAKNRLQVSPYPVLAWVIIAGLWSIGASLTLLQTHDLHVATQIRQWPHVEGTVLETELQAKRSFVPKVTYQYSINGNTYTDKKELFSPQFGGKDTRRQTSQKILAEYEKGGPITVYYNPQNPAESTVEIGVTWATFIKLGVGVLLFAVCTSLMLYKFAQFLLQKTIARQAETKHPA
jgi:hypothetical protein